MSYGIVSGSIWTNEKFCNLSTDAQNFYLFLLSNPEKKNCAGLFQIGFGAITDVKCFENYSRAKIQDLFNELSSNNLAFYESGWVWFHNYLKWNPIDTYKQVKGLASKINEAVRMNAPKIAICKVLSGVKKALGDRTFTNKDGRNTKLVYLFESELNKEELIKFFGSKSDFEACFNGKCLVDSDSPIIGLSKTYDRPLKDHRYTESESESESESRTETKSESDFGSVNTRHINSNPEVKIFCANGQTRLIEPSAVALVMLKTGFDIDEARRAIQLYNMTVIADRPSSIQEDDAYGMKVVEYLKKQSQENK